MARVHGSGEGHLAQVRRLNGGVGLLEHDQPQAVALTHPPHTGQERVGVRPLKARVGEDHGVHVGGSERAALGDELALDEHREHRQAVPPQAHVEGDDALL